MTRIEKLRAALPERFEAALVQKNAHRFYLTGFQSSAGALLITRTDATLFVDSRYDEAAGARAQGVRVERMERLYEQLTARLCAQNIHHLMIENETAVGALASLKKGLREAKLKFDCSNALSGAILRLRQVKDEAELGAVRAAQAITDAAFERILEFIRPGRTEREIAAELEYEMRRRGADGFAFSTIVVSGKNTSMPHGVPGDRPVERGDFVTMDFGAKKDGYCSDMTRTVAVGTASDRMREVYAVVLEAHLRAAGAAKAGVTGGELDAAARGVIEAAGYGDCFGHALGHSLGIDIHESPRASRGSADLFEENSLVTIEPGIYLPGEFGVRIENMVRMLPGGCENLTASPRELLIL